MKGININNAAIWGLIILLVVSSTLFLYKDKNNKKTISIYQESLYQIRNAWIDNIEFFNNVHGRRIDSVTRVFTQGNWVAINEKLDETNLCFYYSDEMCNSCWENGLNIISKLSVDLKSSILVVSPQKYPRIFNNRMKDYNITNYACFGLEYNLFFGNPEHTQPFFFVLSNDKIFNTLVCSSDLTSDVLEAFLSINIRDKTLNHQIK